MKTLHSFFNMLFNPVLKYFSFKKMNELTRNTYKVLIPVPIVLAGGLIIGSANLALAQDAEEMTAEDSSWPITLSGSVDAYFRANLTGDSDASPGTSFANLPGFSLGMANLIASKEGEKVGFTADLVFGPRGEDATFLSPVLRPEGNSSIVNQLFAYWKITESLKVTLGNFNTFLGYEVISPTGNFNYSTSYLFSYGPFSHTGIKFDYTSASGLRFMAGFFNPTDATEFNPVDEYVGGVQVGYSLDKGSIFLNALFDDDFFQIDLTAGYDLTESIYLGVNASSASDSFYGAAAYVQVATSEALKIGGRFEYFSDKGVGILDTDENIIDFTLSANYKVGSLTIIPEYRIDIASQDVFTDANELSSSLSSFVLAAVYGF